MKNTLLQDFKIQWRVIYALIIREIHTRYGRENIGFLWVLGEPLVFCGAVALLWTAIRPSHEHGLPMTAMVVTGYVPLTMWRHALGRSIKAFQANGALLFHRQVTPLDIIFARTWLEVIGTIMAGLIIGSLAIFLGYMKPPEEPSMIFLGMGLLIVFCFATSYLFAALSEMSELVEKVLEVASYLSLPFTGAFFMVHWLPPSFRWVLMASPIAECIEMVRAGEFGVNGHATYDLGYAVFSNFILLILGVWLTLRVRKYLLIQ